MGRQAHLTRLALGRSPFTDPLRDEDGDFILGPNAREHDAPGYRQQFDERGHPQNRSSNNAARNLRTAQNNVLATIGVVVKKGEERKTKWERLEADEKWDLLCDENQLGSHVKAEDRVAGVFLPWFIVSLRRRLMCFKNYSTVTPFRIITGEYRSTTLTHLLFAGLPFHSLSCLPQLFRYYIGDRNVEGIVNYNNYRIDKRRSETLPATIRWYSANTLMRCIELPLLVHATLQSLQVIPASVGLGWASFIPFTAGSPIALPVYYKTATGNSIIDVIISLVHTPFVLYLLRDHLHVQVGYRFYALFRQLLVKPDRPDAVSAKVSDESENIENTSIAGVGYSQPSEDRGYEKHRRFYGPRSFFGALRLAFPTVYELLNTISSKRLAKSRGNLEDNVEKALRAIVLERYWEQRNRLDDQPRRGSPDDLTLRQATVIAVFRSLNLNPAEELVDPVSWTNDVLGPKADVQRFQTLLQQPSHPQWNDPTQRDEHRDTVTNLDQHDEAVSNVLAEVTRMMPVSDVIIIQASDGQVMIIAQQSQERPRNFDDMDNIHTIDAAQVPLEAFIQGARTLRHLNANEEEEQHTVPDQAQSPPPTPTPGLSRAISLSDHQISSPIHNSLRPLRRPTETDDSLAAISQSLRAEAVALQSPRQSQTGNISPLLDRGVEHTPQTPVVLNTAPYILPRKLRSYRVTMLSNHPADSLAWHASALATSLVLWPFETIWLRSVARWALGNPTIQPCIDQWWAARLGFGVIGRPVSIMEPSIWLGGGQGSDEKLKYMGSILLTIGVEGALRGLCWATGVWYVQRWKDRYGWGQF